MFWVISVYFNIRNTLPKSGTFLLGHPVYIYPLLFLALALQPAVGSGLSNNTSPFFPILHQLSPSSHFQHLKISFYLTLHTVLQELENSLQLPKYIPSPFPSIIIKSIQLIPLLNFSNNKFFTVWGC